MARGLWLAVLWLIALSAAASAVHTYGQVMIGALLSPAEQTPSLTELALKQAIDSINTNSNRSTSLNITWHRLAINEDSFASSKRVCQMFQQGVLAILGPRSDALSEHVRSMCDHKSVPLLETRWIPGSRRPSASIGLYPHPATLGKAVADIVQLSGWQNLTVVYEDNQSLLRVQEVLHLTMQQDSIQITLQQLPLFGDYRHVLRKMRDEGAVNFLVECSTENVLKFLKHAQMVGMIIKKYSYFITSLDLHTLPLEDFLYSGSNITGLRLIDPRSARVLTARHRSLALSPALYPGTTEMTTEAALACDAVELLARALDSLHRSGDVQGFNMSSESLSCDTETAWSHGETLINYLLEVQFEGLTGHVSFDTDGLRKSFQLDIVQLREPELVKIGSWSRQGIEVVDSQLESEEPQTNQTIIVTTVMKKPYTMLRPSSTLRRGNDRYMGICVDLMDMLAKIHNFNYTLIVNREGTAGKPDKDGNWNGMIGDLLSGKAHLAIADLTITATRGKAINFTTQWMSLGISMVFTKPTKQPPSLFSFLAPFSREVWAYMGMAMVGVSLLMFVLARFSPYEWQNPHPCDDDPDQLENVITTRNGFWFAIGSLMQQGSDIAPKAMSTRMIAGIWWGFTLIMISSYTANLAAFLTIETRYSPIQSAGDLVKPRNSHIKYGLYERGTTAGFFKRSRVEPFKQMWQVMNRSQDVFRNSDEDGINSVIKANGKFAYFMESSSIEYYVARRCELTQVGGLLDNKGYGIGVGPHSPISASKLSVTIIQLQEEGRLSQLKQYWWKGETGGVNCDAEDNKGVKSPLSLKNVGGVFVCLIFGLCVATLVTVVEFVLAAYRTSCEEGVPLAAEISRELHFVFQFRGNTKPVKRPVTGDADADEDGFIPFSTDSSLQYAATGYGFPSAMT